MNTSEPRPETPHAGKEEIQTDVWFDGAQTPAGLPDPAVFARMANEFFTSLRGFSQPNPPVTGSIPAGNVQSLRVPADAASLPNPENAASSVSQPDAAFLAESELRAIPSTLAHLSTHSAPSTAAIPALPISAIPVTPSFSFLDEARPLFSEATTFRIPDFPFSDAKNPFDEDTRTVPTGVLNAIALPNVAEIGAPAVLGAPRRPEAAERAASYGFLDEIGQLFPVDVAPAVETIGPKATPLPDLGLSSRSFDVNEIRRDFPILQERVNGRPLIWLDSAATTQKPQSVIDRLSYFYAHENSNVHRAAHELAARSTDAYEAAREKVRRFLNASSVREIVFVRGATEGINLVAQSWGRQNIRKDDEIVITWLEHHANIVPWLVLCAEKGARLRVAPVDNSGQIILDEYAKLLGPRTRLVSLAQVSNALGTVTPAREMIEMAHRHGAKVLLDGAQAVSHMPVDVQLFDCDFYVFSGHKVFAPTGIGAVYGKLEVLEYTPPWQGGGSMIQDVTFEKVVYQTPPARFEAGTGNIADAVGLGAAIDYVERIGMANIARYEHDLLAYATEALQAITGLHLIGTAKEKASVLSFVLDGFRTEDVGTALNREGIAVRAGHHCAQPIHRRFNIESSVRASLALYNTCEEIDALVAALWNLKQGRAPALL